MSVKTKDIKIGDLISYLFSSSDQIPEEFIIQSKNVKRYVIYLFEYIWHFPKMIEYFQKYNHLYNREIDQNPLEFLKFLKQILKDNNISRYQFKANFFNFYQALQKVKKIEEEASKQKRQFQDVFIELKLAQILNTNVKLNTIKDLKKKDQANIKEKIIEAQKTQAQQIQKEAGSRKRILERLDKDTIEKHQLTLIDVFIDEKHNKLIYIFLDKNFKKSYYIENFNYDFYISKEFGIINNDFLEEFDQNKFIKYTLYNFWDYSNLRRSVNKNYNNFMKQEI